MDFDLSWSVWAWVSMELLCVDAKNNRLENSYFRSSSFANRYLLRWANKRRHFLHERSPDNILHGKFLSYDKTPYDE